MFIDIIHFLMVLWVIFGSLIVTPEWYPTVLFTYVLIMCHWAEGVYKQTQHYCYLSELVDEPGKEVPDSFLRRLFGWNVDFWILTEIGYYIVLGQILFLFWKIHPGIYDPWINRFFLLLFLALYLKNVWNQN